MKRITLTKSILLLAVLALTTLACQKDDDDKSDESAAPAGEPGTDNTGAGEVDVDQDVTPPDPQDLAIQPGDLGVLPSEGDLITVGGTLALDLALQSALPNKVIALPVQNGAIRDMREAIEVDVNPETGFFALELPKEDPTLVLLEKAVRDDGTVDRPLIVEEYGELPPGITDAEIIEYLDELREDAELGAGATWVMAAYQNNADRLAAAATFTYVGLPSGEYNFINMPIKAAKGNLGLGTVAIDGSDAVGELTLSDEVFDLSNTTLRTLALTNDPLKGIKNAYINFSPDSGQGWASSPFFAWQADQADAVNQWSLPTQPNYTGYGLYVSGSPTSGVTLADICGADAKTIELVPPAAIASSDYADDFSPDNPFTNAGASAPSGTNSERQECFSNTEGYYAASDYPDSQDVIFNWGTGGSLQGDIPGGLFRLKIDGTDVGWFDLAAMRPFNPDGRPIVFIPSANVTADASTNEISQIQLKFHVWDQEAGQFNELSDLDGLFRGVNNLRVELDDYDGTPPDGNRITEDFDVERPESGGTVTFDLSSANYQWHTKDANGANDVRGDSLSVSYQMFGVNFRFEWR